MKIHMPEVFKQETEQLFNNFLSQIPEIVPDNFHELFNAYMKSHASSLCLQFLDYYNSRSGDEGQLLDKSGNCLYHKDGTTVHNWCINDDKYILDHDGNQLFYSDGDPIMAKQMSQELLEFLKDLGWFDDDFTEDIYWY